VKVIFWKEPRVVRPLLPPSIVGLRMTTLSSWNVLIFTVSIVLAGLAGFKAGERSKNAGAIVEPTPKRPDLPRTPPTEVLLCDLDSRTEVETDEEAQADGDVGSVQTNGPCKLASELGLVSNPKMTV
jgi:hypothetical protein